MSRPCGVGQALWLGAHAQPPCVQLVLDLGAYPLGDGGRTDFEGWPGGGERDEAFFFFFFSRECIYISCMIYFFKNITPQVSGYQLGRWWR